MFVPSAMILLAGSAAFVGLMHSLSPGHWLPVVIMTRTKRWPRRTALMGALVAASGHIIISILIAGTAVAIGATALSRYEDPIEHYSGLALVAFGLSYAIYALKRHSHCHEHGHHGPDYRGGRGPFLFLFSVGFSPCVAVLPLFVAAAPHGKLAISVTMVAFAAGVIGALSTATLLVTSGLGKSLDSPLFEHYADVITGGCVALLGTILFLLPSL